MTERTIFQAIDELARRHQGGSAIPTSEAPLTRFEYRAFSQNGEDGVLAEMLRRVGVRNRWFVEFGVETGAEGNCVFLADVLDWSGLFMEADASAYASLAAKYRSTERIHTAQALVTPDNVQDLLASAGAPRELDVLSIDVDGNDYWIWRALTDYAPRIVVIEYNANWPAEKRWVQPYDENRVWQGTDNFGASLGALQSLASEKGYRLVHTELTGVNAFFVRDDLDAALPSGGAVQVRAANYFFMGAGHKPHGEPAPPIVDLDAPAAAEAPAPPVRSRPMHTAERQRRSDEHAFWWHSIDLGEGIVTPGHKPLDVLEQELAALQLPDLTGKSVLDIGAWDGYFSFAAERLGASRVVALDFHTWATDPTIVSARTGAGDGEAPAGPSWDPHALPGKRGFDLAREALGSSVESVFGDLLELDPAALGQFDVVLFLGVLYHTRYPVEMIERVAALTRELTVLETESFTIPGLEGHKLGEFFETDELAGDDSNWWSLSEPAIAGICRSSGFARVDFLRPYHAYVPTPSGLTRHRALAHVKKTP